MIKLKGREAGRPEDWDVNRSLAKYYHKNN